MVLKYYFNYEGVISMYIVGIDGGGSKTTGVISDRHGQVISQYSVKGTNLNSSSRSSVAAELEKLITRLGEKANISLNKISTVFAGMAGAGNPDNQLILKELITTLLPSHVSVIVDTDALIALYSGTLGKPGIVHIAGTGSISYGLNHHGKRARVGGWGYLIGDHGSGFAIGKAALAHVFSAYDGLEEPTTLTEAMITFFEVETVPDLIPIIYQSTNSRETIASICKKVINEAVNGDLVAQSILKNSAEDMANSISGLAKKLFQPDDDILIVLAGSLFKSPKWFLPAIKNDHSEIIIPKVPPVAGALIGALCSMGEYPGQNFMDTLQKTGLYSNEGGKG